MTKPQKPISVTLKGTSSAKKADKTSAATARKKPIEKNALCKQLERRCAQPKLAPICLKNQSAI
jgi:hypothetical protein